MLHARPKLEGRLVGTYFAYCFPKFIRLPLFVFPSPNLYISEFKFQYSQHKPTKSRILSLAWSGAIRLTRPYYMVEKKRKKKRDLNRSAMFNTFVFLPPRVHTSK